MAEILWGRWQVEHIEQRHRVTAQEFDQAWHDPHRRDLETQAHREHGPCTLSIGFTHRDRLIEMVWRHPRGEPDDVVFPITAYEPGDA